MNATTRLCVTAALLCIAIPAKASAAAHLLSEYASGGPYSVAAHCDPALPLATINLSLRNAGDAAAKARTASAADAAHALGGETAIGQVAPGAALLVHVPLFRIAGAAGPLGGAHAVSVTVGTRTLPALTITLPPGFCDPAPAGMPAAGGASGGITAVRRNVGRPIALASPVTTVTPFDHRRTGLNLTLAVAPPANLHGAAGGPECAAHSGLAGAFVCTDMVASGNLLLVFDWKPAGGPATVDGYRAYRVDGGRKQLLYTTTNGKDLTLIDLAKPAAGYGGTCYAVSAYRAAHESALSDAFCASGGSVAKTLHLPAQYVRSSSRDAGQGGNFVTGQFHAAPEANPIQVGFVHEFNRHTLGDDSYNFISRAAVAFDLSQLANRKLVSAKLRLPIQTSAGYGNNRSCATDVGTGTEFWWKDGGWIDASFGAGIVPTDTGPVVTADVTALVAPWLIGQPNYGFVLRNADENLSAFADNRCLTSYGPPSLDVIYY